VCVCACVCVCVAARDNESEDQEFMRRDKKNKAHHYSINLATLDQIVYTG